MIVHLIVGEPIENIGDDQRRELEAAFHHLSTLSCVDHMTFGRNVSGRARGYDYAAVIHFKDEGALDTYMKDPDHLKAVEVFNRLMPERLILDYTPAE